MRSCDDFIEVGWRIGALNLIAQENRRVRDRFGAESIFTVSYSSAEDGLTKTLQWASLITGISAERIQRLAR